MFFDDVKKKRTKVIKLKQHVEHAVFDPIDFMSDAELLTLPYGDKFVFDTECYFNFWFIGFRHIDTGKIISFELEDYKLDFQINKLLWILNKFCLIGFNSINYDHLMISCALEMYSTNDLKIISDRLIKFSEKHRDIAKELEVKLISFNHIDLIEVCPLSASLKTYAGRLHAKRMQDLPIEPDALLTEEQKTQIRYYCCNDLSNTQLIYDNLKDQIALRTTMSDDYGQDLRSKSDAQIAETVIISEIAKIRGFRPKKPKVNFNETYHYNVPNYVSFTHPILCNALDIISRNAFTLENNGSPILPQQIKDLDIRIGSSIYRLGIGGLHSSEECVSHIADDNFVLIDRDVESYYPRIIINQGLYPAHLSNSFLTVFNAITERRIAAKAAKNTVVADSLKITINGSFGKFGSMYSSLYSPQLLLQVTITGQLSLLMLIERIEIAGIQVVSANTDGIVIKCPKLRVDDLNAIIRQWEYETNFKTEETQYKAVYSRDVNNYIAVKLDGSCKTKGAYSNPWNDKKLASFRFHKNPDATICVEAVCEFLTKQIPIEKTIKNCQDITKFVCVRNVKGGGEKNGQYLGKVVRWYYAHNEFGEINYVLSGNKVPKSDGALPLMDLPKSLADLSIDYDRYISISLKILEDIGYYKKLKLF
jgi:DNA polymerase elongation subunit (family B)